LGGSPVCEGPDIVKQFMSKHATFRFYEELNDFLSRGQKKTDIPYPFSGNPAVKDAIEALGVPHTEVDLILVNGTSVTFGYHLADGDRVSIYPVFESLDISTATHLRAKPLREPRFILDVHLGRLARYLRLFGFDSLYENAYEDTEILTIAKSQKRTILTRDVKLLKNRAVTHGYWIRSQKPRKQVVEVIGRFDLSGSIQPFHRCITCNGIVEMVDKETVADRLEPKTLHYFDEFYRCTCCGKIYWKGSHYDHMSAFAESIMKEMAEGR